MQCEQRGDSRVRGDSEEIDFSGELWWLRKRVVCIELGIYFTFMKKSLKNIIVVKSYAGAKFTFSLRSPVPRPTTAEKT